MADLVQDLPISASPERLFHAVSTPLGFNTWWTLTATGTAQVGAVYELGFGPEHQWLARVTRCRQYTDFELEMTRADGDWMGTRVGFQLEERESLTWLRFRHTGWPDANEHYRISSHCWALYLRVLRRSLEQGESVPYEARLEA